MIEALVQFIPTVPPFELASCIVILVALAILSLIVRCTFPMCVGRNVIVRRNGAIPVLAVPVIARPAIRRIFIDGLAIQKLSVVPNIGWERERLFLYRAVDGGAGEALELGGVSESHQSGDSDLDHLFDNVLFFCQTVS